MLTETKIQLKKKFLKQLHAIIFSKGPSGNATRLWHKTEMKNDGSSTKLFKIIKMKWKKNQNISHMILLKYDASVNVLLLDFVSLPLWTVWYVIPLKGLLCFFYSLWCFMKKKKRVLFTAFNATQTMLIYIFVSLNRNIFLACKSVPCFNTIVITVAITILSSENGDLTFQCYPFCVWLLTI